VIEFTTAPSAWLVLALFSLAYVGMALGRVPFLQIDRTGIALIVAIILIVGSALDPHKALEAINFPTLFILFGLMILSAQFAASGFYDWCSLRIARAGRSPSALLASVIVVSGVLSAVLANDVVVFAMTPLLCQGVRARGLDPRPFLIGLAGAANAGSASTVIGNPQNILIGQVGKLDFWQFLGVCAVPAVIGLAIVYVVVLWMWRGRFLLAEDARAAIELPNVKLDRAHLVKAVAATILLLALFATPIPQSIGVLVIAALLLISRRLASTRMLGMVDWSLLVLFACLFMINAALMATGLPDDAVKQLAAAGIDPNRLGAMAGISLVASNTIGNVPAVVLFTALWPNLPTGTLHGMAVLTTLAGNLLIVGSIANIIVAERAKTVGVTLGFLAHAKSGIPMTLLSFAAAIAWLWATGVMNF